MKNEYTKKKVSRKDRKACLICQNPTETVLFNASGPDWFYTCDLHLVDNPQFAQPLYPKEYHDLLAGLKTLKDRIEALERKQTGGWDQWIGKWLDKDGKQKPKEGDKEADKEAEGDKEPEKEAPKDTLLQLKKQYQDSLDRIALLKQKSNTYTLYDLVYQSRVDRLRKLAQLKEKKRIEQQSYTNTDPQQLLQSVQFPEVPKDIVQKPSS
ncbi:VFA1-like protein [Kluyveromyces marxianus]